MSDDEGTLPTELSGDAPDLSGIGGIVGDKSLPPWFWRAIVAVAFSVLVFMAIRGALGRLTGLLSLIGVSLFLSFAVEPAVNWLADRGWKRGRATLLCFLVVFGGGGIFAGLMVGLVVGQVSDLAHQAPGYVTDVTNWANETFDTEITSTELNETLADYQDDLARLATDMGGRVLSVTGAAVAVVFQIFTVMLFSYYMIAEGPRLRRSVCSLLPQRRQHLVLRLWELSIEKTGGWVFSRLLLATVAGVTSWVVFLALGLPSPLALAVWLGLVSQFIPVVGTYLGGALPLLVALVNRPITALWVLVWILVYQQVENYLLSPKITAHTMDLHPAVAFGSALAGASLFGPMGAILALPAAAVIQAFVSAYLDRHEVIENDLTKLDRIEATQGESAFRKALRRVSRNEPVDE